ncbi:MAG: hypothetical protein ACI9OH_001164 [Oleispira sp.]|jgi:uncharacterized protein (DUF736 family)
MKKQKLALLIGLSSALFLTACGGSSSSSDNGTIANKVVRGSIDGFGSVIVNGVRYNTDNANFSVNESAGIQADLKVGQVITLLGNASGNNGIASNIIYERDLKGPITAVDGDNFTVLGQTVLTNKLTVYKGLTLPLIVGSSVEISGYISGETLIASYVELNDNSDSEVELRGVIADLNEAAGTFNIRGQQVSYNSTTELDLEGETLANDLRVEVEGDLNAELVLIANEIESDEEIFEKDTELELVGITSSFDLEAQTFTVNGTQVSWNSSTDFDGLNAVSLKDGIQIEVEGSVNAEGVLVAEDIKINDDTSISIEATITELTATDTFSGTITILGIEVNVDMNTRMSDDDENPNFSAMFNFSNLNVGEKVELEISGDTTNGYRAVKLERDYDTDNNGLNEVKIEVPASLINLETKTVLGISFVASAEVSLTVLDNLTADTEVELEGTINGDILTITSIGIDD